MKKKKNFLITGGAGFIGSAMIRYLISKKNCRILNLDKLTYAANFISLNKIKNNINYKFVNGDICNRELVSKIFNEFNPDVVMNFAAETHVDRSIDSPINFVKSNILGTAIMLECSREFWKKKKKNKDFFLFHHVSTDEVFGSLGKSGLFSEKTPYNPSSPYSASKASSDHLVRAWYHTFGLPVIISNCSNNYGPYQFPEKLIPMVILNALEKKPLPVYGNGQNIRDWLYVDDHVRLLYKIVFKGKIGESYNIGGKSEKKNIEVVNIICETLDRLVPKLLKNSKNKQNLNTINKKNIKSFKELITFVPDRPGHDIRYAINTSKIEKELNYIPKENFETGIEKTIRWYLNNLDWCEKIQDRNYSRERLGVLK